MICGVVFQHQDLSIVFNAVQNGVVVETGHAMVDELLTRGGLMSMMWTVSLIICALSFGGILECTGMMSVIANKLLEFAKNTGSLVLVTIISALFCNVLLGDHCIAIAIPGRMFKDEYRKRGLAPEEPLPCTGGCRHCHFPAHPLEYLRCHHVRLPGCAHTDLSALLLL